MRNMARAIPFVSTVFLLVGRGVYGTLAEPAPPRAISSELSTRSDISSSYSYSPIGSQYTPSPTPTPCSHSECYMGDALELGCDPCVTRIILNDSYCGNTYWDASCVDRVTSICRASCPTLAEEASQSSLRENVVWSIEIVTMVIASFLGMILCFAFIGRFIWWYFRPKTASVTFPVLPVAALAEEAPPSDHLLCHQQTPVAAPCSSVYKVQTKEFTRIHSQYSSS